MEGLLPAVLILACPIGMGLMMWLMSKGKMGGTQAQPDDGGPDAPSLSELRAEHERLGAEIARVAPTPGERRGADGGGNPGADGEPSRVASRG